MKRVQKGYVAFRNGPSVTLVKYLSHPHHNQAFHIHVQPFFFHPCAAVTSGQREEHISPLILSWFTYLHTRSHAIRSTFIDGLCTAGKPMAQPTSINLRLPVGKDRRTSKRGRSRSSSELQSTTALDHLNSPPSSVRKSSQSSCLDSNIIVLRAQTVEAWI